MILQWFKSRSDGRAGEIDPATAARVLRDRAKRKRQEPIERTCDTLLLEMGHPPIDWDKMRGDTW